MQLDGEGLFIYLNFTVVVLHTASLSHTSQQRARQCVAFLKAPQDRRAPPNAAPVGPPPAPAPAPAAPAQVPHGPRSSLPSAPWTAAETGLACPWGIPCAGGAGGDRGQPEVSCSTWLQTKEWMRGSKVNQRPTLHYLWFSGELTSGTHRALTFAWETLFKKR